MTKVVQAKSRKECEIQVALGLFTCNACVTTMETYDNGRHATFSGSDGNPLETIYYLIYVYAPASEGHLSEPVTRSFIHNYLKPILNTNYHVTCNTWWCIINGDIITFGGHNSFGIHKSKIFETFYIESVSTPTQVYQICTE